MVELIISQIWPYILAGLALVAGWFAARQSGKAAARNEINETQAQARKESRRVEDENASLDDADVDSRLDKWVRNRKQ